MSELYDPSLMKIVLRNKVSEQLLDIDPESLAGNIYMERDDGELVELELSVVDKEIHVMPLEQYQEGRSYKLTFKKTIRKKNGKRLRKNYFMSFRVHGSKFIMLKSKSDEFDDELL